MRPIHHTHTVTDTPVVPPTCPGGRTDGHQSHPQRARHAVQNEQSREGSLHVLVVCICSIARVGGLAYARLHVLVVLHMLIACVGGLHMLDFAKGGAQGHTLTLRSSL